MPETVRLQMKGRLWIPRGNAFVLPPFLRGMRPKGRPRLSLLFYCGLRSFLGSSSHRSRESLSFRPSPLEQTDSLRREKDRDDISQRRGALLPPDQTARTLCPEEAGKSAEDTADIRMKSTRSPLHQRIS